MSEFESQISRSLRKRVEAAMRSKDPLAAAKDLLAEHAGRPYFNDLKKELRIALLLKRASPVNA